MEVAAALNVEVLKFVPLPSALCSTRKSMRPVVSDWFQKAFSVITGVVIRRIVKRVIMDVIAAANTLTRCLWAVSLLHIIIGIVYR